MREFEELRINNKVVYKPQRVQKVFHNAILNRDENGYRDFLFGGSAKPGKDLDITTLIPMSYGYKLMQDIMVGDYVFGENGLPTRVIWTSEIRYDANCYEIEFDTGEKIIASDTHLWKTWTRNNLKGIDYLGYKNTFPNISLSEACTPIVKTTKEIFDTIKCYGAYNHTVQNCRPIKFSKQNLPIDPYILGYLLGDGDTSGKGRVACDPRDREYLLDIFTEKQYIVKPLKDDGHFYVANIKEEWKKLKLDLDKYIPLIYLRSSVEQRLMLLRGLIDSDGYIDNHGTYRFSNTNELLADGFCELVASLGLSPRKYSRPRRIRKGVQNKRSFECSVSSIIPLSMLPRKLNRARHNWKREQISRRIINIKQVEPVPVKCIQVENPDGMYLIGRTFIPTHNSYALRWEAHRNGLEYENIKILLIRSSFPELENTHLLQLQFDFSPGIISYNGQRHRATYLSTNSILQFGYGDKLTDFSQYLSTEWDVLLIDELTTIPFEFSYLLRSRLAGSRKDFTPFWANASNPGNRAHASVKAYFMDKNPDKEIYTKYKESEVLYIHSTVYDNLVLLERDPEVLKRLQQLPPREQQKYLYGNWDIFEGAMFNFNREVHLIDRENYLSYDHILSSFNVMASIDYGNVTVVALGAKDSNGNVIIFDEWKDKGSSRIEKIQSLHKFLEVRNMLNIDIIADTNMWIPDAFDVEDTNVAAYDFIEAGFNLYPVSKSGKGIKNRSYRIMCNDTIQTALHYKLEDNEIKVQPKLKFYSRCKYIIESLSNLIADPNDPDDIADNQDDHGYDALKYLYMNFMTPVKRKDEDKYEWLKKARLRKMKQLSQQTTVLSE